MRYQKIYNQLIERAKTRNLYEYNEKHHIIPKCLGGTNDKKNIVKLTFREHFLSHRLLCKIYPDNKKIFYAFSSMIRVSHTNFSRWSILSAKHFDIVKTAMKPFHGKWNIGKIPWNKGLTGDEHINRYKSRSIPPSMLGRVWINDGNIHKKILKNEQIPDGWSKGRIGFSENNPMKIKNIVKKNLESRKFNKLKELI